MYDQLSKKDLKLIAGNLVMESDYSNSAKKQLLNFIINEATDEHLKSLILDGDFDIIDENTKYIINKRFDNKINNMIDESIEDTNDFINVGRDVICNVLESQDNTPEEFENMVEFVINEATPYQVLSMLMEDVLPEEANNSEREFQLVESLNEISGLNFIPLTELTPKSKNMTTNFAKNIVKKKVGNKPYWTPGTQQFKIPGKLNLNKPKSSPSSSASISTDIQKNKMAKSNVVTPKPSLDDLKKSDVVTPTMETGTTGGLYSKQKPSPSSPASISAAIQKNKMAKAPEPITTRSLYNTGIKKAKELAAKGKAFATTPTGQAVGGLAAAALIAYAAYKVYKNYFSKAAVACEGAPDKGVCMRQYRNKAIQAQIAQLRSHISQCNNSKNPGKCKAAITNKIAGLQSKIR